MIMSVLTLLIWLVSARAIKAMQVTATTLAELQALSPEDFEEWVAACFRKMGYSAKVTGTHGTGGDHRVDVIAKKPGEKAVVQCKSWKVGQVGEPEVRDLYGAMRHYRADKAYLVTSGCQSPPDQGHRFSLGCRPLNIVDP